MSTPSFKYGNGVWATKEGSSLAYNDDNGNYKPLPFSVTRASSATRVNKQGLIEVVGNDRLRIDYSESANGVALLEPSRTNFALYSEEFDNAAWQKQNVTLTSNYELSPSGDLTADRVVTTNTGVDLYQNITVVANTSYRLTFYAKLRDGENIQARFYDLSNSSNISYVNYSSQLSSGEWKRVEVGVTTPVGCTSLRVWLVALTSTLIDVSFWGAQLEQGSYATSYIPTSGSTATRQADVANGAGVANVFNDSEGVLYADIAGFKAGYSRVMTISDESVNNRVTLFYPSLADTLYARVVSGGVSNPDIIVSINESLFNKVALKYKANDLSLWINGFEVGTETSATMPVGLSEFAFDNGATTSWEGKAKGINVYKTALTDAELEYLTSYRSLAEMATELNLNAL